MQPFKARCTRHTPKKPLATQSILDALAQTVPLSTTRAEEIGALREWTNKRAVPASSNGKPEKSTSAVSH